MKKNILIAGLATIIILLTSCKDQFSDINTDPEKTDPRIEYLFTGALYNMNGQDYYPWFLNYNTSLPWTQLVASSGGNDIRIAYMMDLYEEFEAMINVKKQLEAIKYERKKNPELGLSYVYLEAMCTPMVVYMGLLATDGAGSIPYSEAGKAYFEGESAFRPKFDTQKELFEFWLQELDVAITTLSNKVLNEDGQEVAQFRIDAQDFVYNGDNIKWAKFANALRLKIAARVMHQDIQWAKQIVENVMKQPLPETPSDDFVWNPGSQWINSGNGFQLGTGAKNIIDFLVKHKDPRVRFIFYKNSYNEHIVDGFLVEGKKLPSYIDKYVETTVDENGNKRFSAWKSPGEPWVRYHGVPADLQSKEYEQNMQDYYTVANRELGTGDQKKSYSPWSGLNETMLKGRYSYSYPSLPGESSKKDETEKPTHFTYMSAAEVNLYLAEFKVLDFPGVSGSAAEYYKKAIEYSVLMYDNLAKENRIPYYYETTGLPTDITINLKDGEIEEMLSQPDYQLTGSKKEQLEKIYIQMYIHFALAPQDLLTTVRRSGVPMKNSSYFAQEPWDSKTGEDILMPRRFQIRALAETDELYENRKKAYDEQGFTPGANDPTTLNSQRIWYDVGAPNYGEGPNY